MRTSYVIGLIGVLMACVVASGCTSSATATPSEAEILQLQGDVSAPFVFHASGQPKFSVWADVLPTEVDLANMQEAIVPAVDIANEYEGVDIEEAVAKAPDPILILPSDEASSITDDIVLPAVSTEGLDDQIVMVSGGDCLSGVCGVALAIPRRVLGFRPAAKQSYTTTTTKTFGWRFRRWRSRWGR